MTHPPHDVSGAALVVTKTAGCAAGERKRGRGGRQTVGVRGRLVWAVSGAMARQGG